MYNLSFTNINFSQVLEEFLQRLEIPLDDEIEKWEQVWVRSNTSNELMVCVTVENPYEIDIQDLTKLYDTGLGKDCNVKSLYLGVKTRYTYYMHWKFLVTTSTKLYNSRIKLIVSFLQPKSYVTLPLFVRIKVFKGGCEWNKRGAVTHHELLV